MAMSGGVGVGAGGVPMSGVECASPPLELDPDPIDDEPLPLEEPPPGGVAGGFAEPLDDPEEPVPAGVL
jgi:hypothetical protein